MMITKGWKKKKNRGNSSSTTTKSTTTNLQTQQSQKLVAQSSSRRCRFQTFLGTCVCVCILSIVCLQYRMYMTYHSMNIPENNHNNNHKKKKNTSRSPMETATRTTPTSISKTTTTTRTTLIQHPIAAVPSSGSVQQQQQQQPQPQQRHYSVPLTNAQQANISQSKLVINYYNDYYYDPQQRGMPEYYYDYTFSMFRIPKEEWNNQSYSMSFGRRKKDHHHHELVSKTTPNNNNNNNNDDNDDVDETIQHHHDNIPALKVYVYDTLPLHLTRTIEDYLVQTYTGKKDHVENFKSELGLIYLFQTYPHRTWNPNEADIYVVPYAAEGHCQYAKGYTWNCGQVSNNDMDALRSSLLYLNETSKRRHLFLLAGARAKPVLWSKPFQLTTAPTRKPGQIVIPTLEDLAPYQPSVYKNHRFHNDANDWWTKRKRKYAFSFIYGGRNEKMNTHTKNNMTAMAGGRVFRDYLEQYIATEYYMSSDHDDSNNNNNNNNNRMKTNGQPFVMQRLPVPHNYSKLHAFSYYNESIFCPCLPGDLAWQKRFFDAILNGCLPVVLSFTLSPSSSSSSSSTGTNSKSWFLPESFPSPDQASVQQTYPFAKGAFSSGDDGGKDDKTRVVDWEIDYESFVIQVPMDDSNLEDVSGVMRQMEDLLANQTALQERQLAMKRNVIALTYGMGKDAHVHDDAFARILKAIRFYLNYRIHLNPWEHRMG